MTYKVQNLNENNLFVYLVKCEDYNTKWDDAIVRFLILSDTIEEAIEEAHLQVKTYGSYRINSIEFIGSVGIYVVGNTVNKSDG